MELGHPNDCSPAEPGGVTATAGRGVRRATAILSAHRGEEPRNRRMQLRCHEDHKLVWAAAGALAIQADGRDWVLPSTHALWIPGGVLHSSRELSASPIYRIRIDHRCSPVPWSEPTSFAVGPLMRELIIYLADRRDPTVARHDAEQLLLDLLSGAHAESLHVPLPRDPRARAVAEALIDHPDDDRDLGAWGLEVGASIRTLTRLFTAETGMTFSQWRAQVRMRAALELLAEGLPPSKVSSRVGYSTPSAFVSAFHRLTGRTPGEVTSALKPRPGREHELATSDLRIARQQLG